MTLGSPILSLRALIMGLLRVLVSPRRPEGLAIPAIEPRVLRPASPGFSRVVASLAIVICSCQDFYLVVAFAGRPRTRSSWGRWQDERSRARSVRSNRSARE